MPIKLKAKHIKVLKLVYTVVENNPREGLRYSGKTRRFNANLILQEHRKELVLRL